MRRATLIIALLLALAVSAAPAAAATWVSYPALLEQVRSGSLTRAVINRGPAHVEIKFRDLSEWEATYPRSQQPQLQRLLQARHIQVIFATPPRARHATPATVHHTLRYVAAGVLVALLLSGAAIYLHYRRRRGVPAPGAGSPER
jgi:hypothetical protein